MRAWCLLLCGCYLQPTVFEGGARIPRLEPPPPPVLSDDPVGCITHERLGRRRSWWWLGKRRVQMEEIDRALAAWPPGAVEEARARRDHRLALGLWLAGAAVVIGSISGLVGWLHSDDSSRDPLLLLLPAAAGYALDIASVPVAIRGDRAHRRAIDDFNDAAAAENRCPP